MDVNVHKDQPGMALSDQEFHNEILRRMNLPKLPFQCKLALNNDVVMQHLFRFLGVNDLKNIRLVCKHWKRLSEPIFRKRAQIRVVFRDPTDVTSEEFLQLRKLIDDSESNFLPYTSLQLYCTLPTHFSKLKDFFLGEGSFLTNLNLKAATFRDENNTILRRCNVSKMIGPNLRSLRLGAQGTRLIVCTDVLSRLKYITLNRCVLELNGGKISGIIQLELNDTRFTRNGEPVIIVDIAEFVNYEKLQVLRLTNRGLMRTDFLINSNKRPLHLKKLGLSKVKVEDWELISWKVDVLSMTDIKWDKKNLMEIDMAILRNMSVDLDVLQNVRKISAKDVEFIEYEESKYPSKLEFLSLYGGHYYLQSFTECPNLADIELLYGGKSKAWDIKMKWIPKGLKRLSIITRKLQSIRFVGKTFPRLEQLLILGAVDGSLKHLVRRWNPLELVLNFPWNATNEQLIELVHESFTNGIGSTIKKEDRFCKPLWIGPFNWDSNCSLNIQHIKKLASVDTKSQFYCFKNGKGTAVHPWELPTM